MSKPAANVLDGTPVALYLRRSTSLQDQSIGSQRDYLTRYAAEHELAIVREYVDDAISGTSVDGRNGFQRLIADAQGKADFRAVLTYDVKRFSRGDVDEVGHFRYLLRQKGIEVIYATEEFGDDFAGDLLRPIRQVMARQERAWTSPGSRCGATSARSTRAGTSAACRPKAELARVDKELGQLKADADRLLASLTPVNAEFVDEKLLEIKRRRRELEARRDSLAYAADRDLDLEATTGAALAYLTQFREVLDQHGTFPQQKEFLGRSWRASGWIRSRSAAC